MLAASSNRLRKAIPESPRVADEIAMLRTAMIHAVRCDLGLKPLLSSRGDLLDYLRADMALMLTERVRILHLNTQNRLIRDEVLSDGTIDEASFHIREIVRRAIELGSASIIVAHNHPGGSPTPSLVDIDLTRRLANACGTIGITLVDHIIVASEGHASFRTLGYL